MQKEKLCYTVIIGAGLPYRPIHSLYNNYEVIIKTRGLLIDIFKRLLEDTVNCNLTTRNSLRGLVTLLYF